MTTAKIALLPDRGVVAVTGEDARKLLQGVLTNDMDAFDDGAEAIHAGLLTPQGKIMHAFFVTRRSDGFLLDTLRERAADLVKRLTMYKLRAKAEIKDVSAEMSVAACWGVDDRNGPSRTLAQVPGSVARLQWFADPRHPALGTRLIIANPASELLPALAAQMAATEVAADAYHAHRIALGVPEGGRDFEMGDAYPHEANFDRLGGVSFTKGCFVGQEVVARMEHKSVVRKRVIRVEGQGLTPGAEIKLGDVAIGTVGSVAGHTGLALVRLDRVAEALDAGQPLTAGGLPVHVDDAMLADYRARVAAKEATP